MPLTPEQIAKIRQKEATTPAALRRNPLNKYTEGWFHVTLNVRGDAPVLGAVLGDAEAPEGSKDAPRCLLTPLGQAIEAVWRGVGHYWPQCVCEEVQVMPEHIHALLCLLPGNPSHLGRIVNGLMIGSTHAYWDTLGIPWRAMRQQLDEALQRAQVTYGKEAAVAQDKVLKAAWQDRDHSRSMRGPALFVRGYNDVEALTPEEIEIKRRYIHDNPRKRLITRSKPDRFRVQRDQHSRNWTEERVMAAIVADRTFRYDADRYAEALTSVRSRLKSDAQGLSLDYIGTKALLYTDKKLPLVCHRADMPLFEQQQEAVLAAARKGWVIVSAFISPRERQIREQLMKEQCPFIEIIDNGIPEKYKGIGRAFYALAEKRLCQITPWTYRYETEAKVSREMCLVMNELARLICRETDDWWKNKIYESIRR